MGIGHIAVGLGLKKAAPRVNTGWLILAAFASDVLLGLYSLAGWEQYRVPADAGPVRYLLFTFPWSHSLLACLLYAVIASRFSAQARCALGLAVLSHFVLDALVHIAPPPLWPGGPAFGAGLWRWLPAELALEAVMLAAGVALYWRAAPQPKGRKMAVAIYAAAIGVIAVGSQLAASAVPSRETLIASWIAGPILFAAIPAWFDRGSQATSTTASVI